MFDVYITNFLDSSGKMSGKQLMFSIPTGSKEGLPVTTAQISASEGAADSFNFTMEPGSPYYNALVQMKTLIQVIYDGTTIFFGRVLTINKSTIFQSKQVHCEGALGFLNDTFYEGVKEELIPRITTKAYYQKLVENHNTFIGSNSNYAWKKFETSTLSIPSSIKSVTKKHEPTSWTDTSSLIRDLTSSYGGYIQAKYEGNKNHLEWYRYYRHDGGDGKRPVVELGKNLIDFSDSSDVDNIFTHLIPVGSNKKDGSTIYVNGYTYTDKSGTSHTHNQKYIPVKLMTSLYSKSALNEGFHNYEDYVDPESDYTPIYKTQSFPNANTQQKLWEYAIDYIKNNYYKAASTYSIKAIDMHVLNPDTAPKILLGEVVDLKYPEFVNGEPKSVTRKLVCKSIQYDLLNPEKNSYTFGVPNELLDHEYGEKEKQEKKAKQNTPVSGKPGGGGVPKPKEDNELTFESIARTVGEKDGLAAYDYMIAQGPMTGSVYCYDPQETNNPSQNPDLWVMTTIVGKCSKSLGVGFAQTKGIYAFKWNMGVPKKIDHYYTKYDADSKKTYVPPAPVTAQTVFGNVATGLKSGVVNGISLFVEGIKSKLGIGATGDRDSEGNPECKVVLNETKTYTDEKGVTRTKDGFVTAVDVGTPEMPSITTRILMADNIITNKLEAVTAVINDLTTNKSTSREIWVGTLNCNNRIKIIGGGGISGTTAVFDKVTSDNFYYRSKNLNIENCFVSATGSYANRTLTLTFNRASGTNPLTLSIPINLPVN